MSFLSNVGNSFSKAIDFVVEKNRKIALINRVKLVIRNEEDSAQRAYISLGKYYYRNLRDEQNAETEIYCNAIENANKRRDRALQKLDDLLTPEEEPVCDCDEDDDCCDCEDCDECFENYEEDLKKLDGIEDEAEDDAETIQNILHPKTPWRDDEQEIEEDEEAADPSYSDTIPTDQP